MWGLIKDLPEILVSFWWLVVPGIVIGAGLGYFLAFWPAVVILTLAFTAFAFCFIGDGGPAEGGIAFGFLGMFGGGIFIGLGLTSILVGTMPFPNLSIPEINWSWLFRS